MKTKRTMRDIKSQYPIIIQVGYCGVQDMLCRDYPATYTAGVYGWNADIYSIAPGIAICTGYRPFGNVKPDRETVSRYEKRAREMRRDLLNFEELATHLHNLQEEFIREVCKV